MLYKCFRCEDDLDPTAVIWVHDAPMCTLCFTDERLAEADDDDFERATGRTTDERIADFHRITCKCHGMGSVAVDGRIVKCDGKPPTPVVGVAR